jgi:hypothetical protein
VEVASGEQSQHREVVMRMTAALCGFISSSLQHSTNEDSKVPK